MAVSTYIRNLREKVGHELLLLPSVTVLPRDEDGRVLLVRSTDDGLWQTIGGLIEVDEAPEDAARREALEEANVEVRLDRLVTATGGPGFRAAYPNGDEVAYVSVVYEATIVAGSAMADGDETTEVGWFAIEDLAALHVSDFTRALLGAVVPLIATRPA